MKVMWGSARSSGSQPTSAAGYDAKGSCGQIPLPLLKGNVKWVPGEMVKQGKTNQTWPTRKQTPNPLRLKPAFLIYKGLAAVFVHIQEPCAVR